MAFKKSALFSFLIALLVAVASLPLLAIVFTGLSQIKYVPELQPFSIQILKLAPKGSSNT